MPKSRYSVAKGDLLCQSKHADVALGDPDGWVLFFLNTPTKGKTLSVEYSKVNWPGIFIQIQANWKARTVVAQLRRKGMKDEVF